MSTNLQLILDATSGNLQFVPITSGGSGTPGGADTNVQFNNSGAFGGSNSFTFVEDGDVSVFLGPPDAVGVDIAFAVTQQIPDGSGFYFANGLLLAGASANGPEGDASYTGGSFSMAAGSYSGGVYGAGGGNIAADGARGTSDPGAASGAVTLLSGAAFNATDSFPSASIVLNGNDTDNTPNIPPDIDLVANHFNVNATLVASGLSYPIADGSNGYVVTTDGAGVLSLQPVSAAPGGAAASVQFNNSGAFGGFGSWDGVNLIVPGSFFAQQNIAATSQIISSENQDTDSTSHSGFDALTAGVGAKAFYNFDTPNYQASIVLDDNNGLIGIAPNIGSGSVIQFNQTSGDIFSVGTLTITDDANNKVDIYPTGGILAQKEDETGVSHLSLYNLAADNSFQITVFDDSTSNLFSAGLFRFNNTVDATAYSVNGNAGASGTGTVISAITVENGIITAITVA